MERQSRHIWIATLALAVFLLGAHDALALGTDAGTAVDNMATIQYDVNAVTQDIIESSEAGNNTPGAGNGTATNFVVDTHVNFTVTEADGTYVDVAPNGSNQVLTYTLYNGGNYWQDFSLSVADGADPFGGTDNFNATPVAIYVENGLQAGYQSSGANQDTGTYVDELAENASTTVYVLMDIPAVQADGDISGQTLTAQVAQSQGGTTGTQGADITSDDEGNADTDAAEIVFDTLNGVSVTGTVSDAHAYRVQSAQLTVAKDSAVISDPMNGVSADAKAIPGAIVEYTITVTNAGTATQSATSISITDSLDTEITAGDIAYTAGSMTVTAPNLYAGVTTALTDAAADDEGTLAANVVTITGINLAPGDTATVTFQVEIQ